MQSGPDYYPEMLTVTSPIVTDVLKQRILLFYGWQNVKIKRPVSLVKTVSKAILFISIF